MNTSPDIIFICSDQWNARYLRCAGHPQVQTPHLDALAAEGCIFDAAYTPSPVCMPARASLASGLYPHAHGFFCNYTGKLFPPEQVTLFRCLQEAGYTTAKIGKYHYFSLEWGQDYEDYRDYYDQLGLDWAEETSTPFQGPFLNTGYSRLLKKEGLLDTFITDIGDRYVDGQYTPLPSPLPPDMTPDGYVCRQTLAYLDRAPTDKPLFLFASFPGPHTPLDAPGKYAKMYDPADIVLPENYNEKRCKYGRQAIAEMTAQYMGKITHFDDRIGEIIAALKKRGNWENTVIVFTSDHGETHGRARPRLQNRLRRGIGTRTPNHQRTSCARRQRTPQRLTRLLPGPVPNLPGPRGCGNPGLLPGSLTPTYCQRRNRQRSRRCLL